MMKKIEWKKLFSNWHVILVVLILGVISYLNFRSDYSILTNDNYSPELNPDVTINRILYSPAWRGYRGLGVASDSEQADLFRAITYKVFEAFLPVQNISQIYILVCLAVGAISFGLLATKIFKDNLYHKFVFLTGSVLYISTLWTAWTFVFPMMPYVSQFAFLPLLLLGIYQYIEKPISSSGLKLFIFGLLYSATTLISTLFLVNSIVIVVFTIYFLLRRKFPKKLVLLCLLIIPQLIWMIPFSGYVFRSSTEVVDSSINRTITESTIDVEKEKMTGVNSSRFYTRVLDIIDSDDSDEKMFVSADNYSKIEGYKVLSYAPVFFALLGFVFVIKSKCWKLIVFWISGIFFWFLLKNQNPPFGQIYSWIQDNLGIFRQIFRWPTSKFGQAFLIFLCLGATFGFISFIHFISTFIGKRIRKYFSTGFVLFIVTLQLVFVGYIFYGELSADRSYVQIPNEYFSLTKYLTENDQSGRVLILPPANNSYFREYDWGFIGSGFLWYMTPNPIQDKALSIGSQQNEYADLELESSFRSGDIDEFEKDLNKYDIKYLLLDRNLVKGRYGYELDFDNAENYTENYERVWSEGDLELYEVNNVIVEQYGEVTPTLLHDFLSEGFITVSPSSPIIYPMFEDSTSSVDGEYITKVISYTGGSSEYSDNLEDLEIDLLPIKISIDKDNLVLEPSTPIFDDLDQTLPYEKYEISDGIDYVRIGDYVVNLDDVEDGYTIDYSYGDIDEVLGIDSIYSDSTEYKLVLDKLPTQDCTGQSKGNSVYLSILDNGDFELESEEGIGCVYSDINLPGSKEYVANFNMKWSCDVGTEVGFCIWSKNMNSCINSERFYYSNKGSMEVDFDLPTTLSNDDEYSITIYLLAKDNKLHSAVFENIEMSYYSMYENLEKVQSSATIINSEVVFRAGKILSLKIPVIHSLSNFVYNSDFGYIGEPLLETETGEYSDFWVDEKGSNIRSKGQNASYYNPAVNLGDLGKYLMFYWSGENVSGIPASLCLNYIDDEKCWVEDVLYSGSEADNFMFFYSDVDQERLYFKLVNQSISNISENNIQQLLVQDIPEGWIRYTLSPKTEVVHSVEILESKNPYSVLYTSELSDIDEIFAIPQTESNGWRAYLVKSSSLIDRLPLQIREIVYPAIGAKIPDSLEVIVDGWKQGWDISGVDSGEHDTVVVVYTPNIGAYVGLFTCIATLTTLVVLASRDLVVKIKKNEKK